jgi:GNAT superfamily N-acetyltransferase
MRNIRLCGERDLVTMLAIINDAAVAYRGVIPPDRWHDPYMPEAELREEIAAGVEFWGLDTEGGLVGIMGVQPVRDVDLIRHAYVRPDQQRHGVGAQLIEYLRQRSARRMLVGTWAAASWAISFYERHGFELVAPTRAAELLRDYWTIPERQIETSVVLANPPVVNGLQRGR